MKKFLSIMLAAAAALCLVSCAPKEAAEPIKIGALKGPTGMGMTLIMGDDYAEKYAVTLSSAPDELSAKLISGEVDIAAVPLNLASALYNKTEGKVVLLALNTLGVLYVLENGSEVNALSDLAGKTLYATGQGSTPEYMLMYLLEKAGLKDSVTVEFLADHSELASLMAAGERGLGMLPEPNVSAVLLQNGDVRVALDLTKEWKDAAGVEPVQGCLAVRSEFLASEPDAVSAFLEDYALSVAYVNENIDEASALMETYGIVGKAAIARSAIPKSNIVCVTGDDMRAMAEAMLGVLYTYEPKSIGGALPGDAFYGD